MTNKKRRDKRGAVKNIATAVFAVSFVLSLVFSYVTFAAANLFQIQNAELTSISDTAEGSITSFDEQTIVNGVNFHEIGDFATYKVTLKNTDVGDHIIESITNDNDNDYIIYEHDSYADTTVASGASFDFVVTAKYMNAVTDINSRVQTTSVKFIIKYVDVEEPDVCLAVPNTGDNAISSIGSAIQNNTINLVVSAIGLSICLIICIKNHKKSAKILGVMIAAVAAVTIFTGVKAATTEVNSFTLTSNYGLYDKNVVTYDGETFVIDHCAGLSDIVGLSEPDKTGYIFSGFKDQNNTPVTSDTRFCEDTTISPTFTPITYKIHFIANGAPEGTMADQTFTYDEAQNLTENAYNWPGHTYGG